MFIPRFPQFKGCLPAVALCVFILALCGCNQSDRPSLGTVHGRVTLDGKPLADACVGFKPSGPFRASSANTDAQGHYELVYIRDIKGAAVGKHKVHFSTNNPLHHNVEIVPAKFNKQTTLEREVSDGDNELNFDLTSK